MPEPSTLQVALLLALGAFSGDVLVPADPGGEAAGARGESGPGEEPSGEGFHGRDLAWPAPPEPPPPEAPRLASGRRPRTRMETPGALFVLDAEDIRRSGATSVPELLRLVPGLQVAQGGASTWAVSARGFHGLFAEKLLVLVDGRSVNSPLVSGVHWDALAVRLEDIERIEVTRGPAGSLWGAGAVNGVVHIFTWPAAETRGTAVTGLVGTRERRASLRHGGGFGEDGAFRVWAEGLDGEGWRGDGGGDAEDTFAQGRAGFRLDWSATARDSLTLQGDLYLGKSDPPIRLAQPTPPFAIERGQDLDLHGGSLLGGWSRELGEGHELGLRASYDRASREGALWSEVRDSVELDLQHRFRTHARNEVLWGLAYRGLRTQTEGSVMVEWDPRTRRDDVFGLFVQDELAVHEDLRLILGARLEHNDYTQYEFQPTARAVWTPSSVQTVWAAVSRAVRTPSHSERGITLLGGSEPGLPPTRYVYLGDEDFRSEELLAYELGWRAQLSPKLFLDVACFYNDYDELASLEVGPPSFDGTSIVVPYSYANQLSGETYGFEVAADWQPDPRWRFQAAYALLGMDLEAAPSSSDEGSTALLEGSSPRHQGSLRAWRDLGREWEADVTLFLVERLKVGEVPGYGRLDLRLGWRPRPGVELALVGQGLLHDSKRELADDFFVQGRRSEAAAYLLLRCLF